MVPPTIGCVVRVAAERCNPAGGRKEHADDQCRQRLQVSPGGGRIARRKARQQPAIGQQRGNTHEEGHRGRATGQRPDRIPRTAPTRQG